MKKSKGAKLVPCRRDASLALPYTTEEKKKLSDDDLDKRIQKIVNSPANRKILVF
ncbi:hypothetical protein VP018_000672 [Morganella morganii]|nr:hypothetical protein [Morganella morganii]